MMLFVFLLPLIFIFYSRSLSLSHPNALIFVKITLALRSHSLGADEV